MNGASSIRCEQVIPTLGVGDVAAAIDWTWRRSASRRRGVGVSLRSTLPFAFGDTEIHLSREAPNPGGSWLYFIVSDVDRLHADFDEKDVDIVRAPEDREWDMREMPVRDLVGNELTFASPCIAREPKLPFEREEVSVWLEKRLVAVIRELAQHKGVDMTGLLEETLLHTFEPTSGGSVASPHTPADLDRIAELKERQGIDYDVHASYRFVEEGKAPSDSDA